MCVRPPPGGLAAGGGAGCGRGGWLREGGAGCGEGGSGARIFLAYGRSILADAPRHSARCSCSFPNTPCDTS